MGLFSYERGRSTGWGEGTTAGEAGAAHGREEARQAEAARLDRLAALQALSLTQSQNTRALRAQTKQLKKINADLARAQERARKDQAAAEARDRKAQRRQKREQSWAPPPPRSSAYRATAAATPRTPRGESEFWPVVGGAVLFFMVLGAVLAFVQWVHREISGSLFALFGVTGGGGATAVMVLDLVALLAALFYFGFRRSDARRGVTLAPVPGPVWAWLVAPAAALWAFSLISLF